MNEQHDLKRDMDNDAMGDDRDYQSSELLYCGKCNQRRYFTNGKCEMCSAPAEPHGDALPPVSFKEKWVHNYREVIEACFPGDDEDLQFERESAIAFIEEMSRRVEQRATQAALEAAAHYVEDQWVEDDEKDLQRAFAEGIRALSAPAQTPLGEPTFDSSQVTSHDEANRAMRGEGVATPSGSTTETLPPRRLQPDRLAAPLTGTKWMIVFDDRDRQPIFFDGVNAEKTARETHKKLCDSWTCELFISAADIWKLRRAEKEKGAGM